MDDIKIRKKILNTLYKEYREHGVVGRRFMNELPAELDVDQKAVEFNVQYLVDNDFAKYVSAGGLIAIKNKGVNFVEGESIFNPPPEYRSQSIQISGGSVGQVFQAHDITINPPDFLKSLAQRIETDPEIDPSTKKGWIKSLRQMAGNSAVSEIVRRVFQSLLGA